MEKNAKATVPQILNGLLNKDIALQVKCSKEYAEHHTYFDKTVKLIERAQDKRALFDEWSKTKLYPWQFKAFELIMHQNDRTITWVVDAEGNHGKTHLAKYMYAVYDFFYASGTMPVRDIAQMLDRDINGIIFDVSRSAASSFDYIALEGMYIHTKFMKL